MTIKAPSEKHLEDWIYDNPQKVCAVIDEPNEHWDGNIYYIRQIVGRQIELPSGKCDLLVLATGEEDLSLCAVEIKRDSIDSRAIAQCLRYMRDLKEVLYWMTVPLDETVERLPSYSKRGIFDYLHGYGPEITGMLIGHGIEDENLLIACKAASIKVLSYDYRNKSYTFESISPAYNPDDVDIYHNLAKGVIGDAIREVVKNRVQQDRRHRESTKNPPF